MSTTDEHHHIKEAIAIMLAVAREHFERAMAAMQAIDERYRLLILRVSRGCIYLLVAITINLSVAHFQGEIVKYFLWAMTFLCTVVLFNSVRLLIKIINERRLVKDVIKMIKQKIYNLDS